jgi:hypothetical protein
MHAHSPLRVLNGLKLNDLSMETVEWNGPGGLQRNLRPQVSSQSMR